MIKKDKIIYTLKRTELENITSHQLEDFIKDFELDDKGNVLIPYEHKGYTCNDKIDLFMDSDIQAISFFQVVEVWILERSWLVLRYYQA